MLTIFLRPSLVKALDIFDCPVSEIEEYRPKIFEALPNLKFLNGFDINDEEADDLEESDAEDSGGEMGYEDEGSDIEEGEEEEIGLGMSYFIYKSII